MSIITNTLKLNINITANCLKAMAKAQAVLANDHADEADKCQAAATVSNLSTQIADLMAENLKLVSFGMAGRKPSLSERCVDANEGT
jgi:hypothetical protein